MPILETEEQARSYLREVYSGKEFRIQPFESGWACREIVPPAENRSRGLGLPALIIDKETGIVTVQSSLPITVVAKEYAEAKRTGRPLPGRQIYPYRQRITLRRIREDDETIEYQMTVTSLTDPPEPTEEHPVRIDKQTLRVQPTDRVSSKASSHAAWVSRQNQGGWPELDTMDY